MRSSSTTVGLALKSRLSSDTLTNLISRSRKRARLRLTVAAAACMALAAAVWDELPRAMLSEIVPELGALIGESFPQPASSTRSAVKGRRRCTPRMVVAACVVELMVAGPLKFL